MTKIAIILPFLLIQNAISLFPSSDTITILSKQNISSWNPPPCGFNQSVNIMTKWGKMIDPTNTSTLFPQYPRPQLKRDTNNSWINLNGLWEYQEAVNLNEALNPPFNQTLKSNILIPFPIESCLSGIAKHSFYLWYRIVFSINNSWYNTTDNNNKLLIHFGAIDWQSTIYLNNKNISTHTGGYNEIIIDLSKYLTQNYNELLIFVYDPTEFGFQPNGKQNTQALRGPILDMFTPTSGIWQTVWIEKVPKYYIENIKIITDLKNINISVNSNINVNNLLNYKININAIDPITNDIYTSIGYINQTINILIKNAKLWSPKSPMLYLLNVTLIDNNIGNIIDNIISYTGMRTISMKQIRRKFVNDTGIERSIYINGMLINGYPIDINSNNPSSCWLLCNKTNNCMGWQYQYNISQWICRKDIPIKPKCYLYSNIYTTSDNATFDTCFSSGQKYEKSQNIIAPFLNDNIELVMLGWLDQSFYPDGIYTAPSYDAFYHDIHSVIDFGMNFIRTHEKVNPEYYYYYADILGILIWQDMPQKYGAATDELKPYFLYDLKAMINGRFNHPSIIQWELFNERDCDRIYNESEVINLVNIIRKMDPTRLIDTDSGGFAANYRLGDVFDLHHYPDIIHPESGTKQYAVQGEFGGFNVYYANHDWYKAHCKGNGQNTPENMIKAYEKQINLMIQRKYDVKGFVYTELSDVENECGGFFTYDRINKFNTTQIAYLKQLNQKIVQS
eukprot:103765_1